MKRSTQKNNNKLKREIIRLEAGTQKLDRKVMDGISSCSKLKDSLQQTKTIKRKIMQMNSDQNVRHQEEVMQMKGMLFDLANEIKEKNKKIRKEKQSTKKADAIAANRLSSLRDLKYKLHIIKEKLAQESHTRAAAGKA